MNFVNLIFMIAWVGLHSVLNGLTHKIMLLIIEEES